MEKAVRHKLILEYIKSHSTASVTDLRERFGVSEMTIRRDLHELDEDGLLRRVHGGAVRGTGRSYEPPYRTRSLEKQDAKQLIGQRAAEFVQDGDSIALDIGTTVMEMLRHLGDRLDLTIVTASLPIAQTALEVFRSSSGLRLILTGGVVREGEMSLIGDFAQNMFANLRVDKAFVGVGGLTPEDGFTEYNLDDTFVKRAMLNSAGEVYVLADGSKFGSSTFASIGPLSLAKAIITDPSAPQAIIPQIQDQGVEVIIAA